MSKPTSPVTLARPVVRGVRYFLAHTPGLVRHGSKPARDIAADPSLAEAIGANLRDFPAAAAYPPNRVLLGALHPDALSGLPRPWFDHRGEDAREGPHGEIMPGEAFLALLKMCDAANLVALEEGFTARQQQALARHPLITAQDRERLGQGLPEGEIDALLQGSLPTLPLHDGEGVRVGCIRADHEQDDTLAAGVLLENLACKATAAMALRSLLTGEEINPGKVGYVLNSGEEAVGDRYQRGGGNLAKAVAEQCGCGEATGVDVKGFCAGPVHALVIAAGLVASRVFDTVAVVGGCSLAKLGMKYRGHLNQGQSILEDVLAGAAVLVGPDDGRSPVLRLDALGRHTVAAGSSQQAILEHLVARPLEGLGLGFQDIGKYATELHNPELTEPGGSGNVPELNYRLIAGLAALRQEIAREDIPAFVKAHGMPGFSPTQGHIASALPFLGHALDGLREGNLQRAMFLAKGSLFLGRMTQLADGMSFILERNSGVEADS